ncbi:MAG: WhiB family transcriptional regulator, partial [Bradyrhizobium sp.]
PGPWSAARCASVFYSPEGERGRARQRREANVKALCSSCPVIARCRAHALAVAEPFGVWGGMSEADRQVELDRTVSFRSCSG